MNNKVCAIVAITATIVGLSVLATDGGPFTLALAQYEGGYQDHYKLGDADYQRGNISGAIFHYELGVSQAPYANETMHYEQLLDSLKYNNSTDAQYHYDLAKGAAGQ